MGAFVSIICTAFTVVIILTVLMYLNTVGIKTLFNKFVDLFRVDPVTNLRNMGSKLSNMAQSMNAEMNVIQLTAGKCDACGEHFICTTEDDTWPIQKVEFMGETRTLCNKCLDDLMKTFRKEGKSSKKNFSETAEIFRGLFTNVDTKSKK